MASTSPIGSPTNGGAGSARRDGELPDISDDTFNRNEHGAFDRAAWRPPRRHALADLSTAEAQLRRGVL